MKPANLKQKDSVREAGNIHDHLSIHDLKIIHDRLSIHNSKIVHDHLSIHTAAFHKRMSIQKYRNQSRTRCTGVWKQSQLIKLTLKILFIKAMFSAIFLLEFC